MSIGVEPSDVRPGDLFVLHDEPDPSWTADAASVSTVADPPPTLTVALPPVRRLFGFTTDRPLVTAVRLGDALHFPLAGEFADEFADDGTIEIRRGDETIATVPAADVVRSDDTPVAKLVVTDIAGVTIDDASDRRRPPDAPEDVVLLSSHADAMPMVGREHLRHRDGYWQIVDVPLGEDLWNGAVVLAATDGAVVGTVVIDAEPRIVAHADGR